MVNFKFKTKTQCPIGLDIGHDSVKMIQLSVNGTDTCIIAAEKVRIDSDLALNSDARKDAVVEAINLMMTNGRFKGKNVVSCLPNDSLKITSLRTSEADPERIEQLLKKEVAERFGMNPEVDTVNYMIAGDVQQGESVKSELILFAATDDAIRNHIEMVDAADLKLSGIETVPCALFRSFERSMRRQEDSDKTVVFVDVGSEFTTVVFGRRDEISFIKKIAVGVGRFNDQISSRLGISLEEAQTLRDKLNSDYTGERTSHTELDPSTRQIIVDAINTVAEELSREISLCFRYYTVTFRGKRVQRAVFSGGGAYERILLNVLKRQLAVEIDLAQPLRGFDLNSVTFGSDRRGLHCEWAVAVGLSLKGTSGDLDEGINNERN